MFNWHNGQLLVTDWMEMVKEEGEFNEMVKEEEKEKVKKKGTRTFPREK